jgi:hypothetical protein
VTPFERLFSRTTPRDGCLIFTGAEPFRVGTARMMSWRAAWVLTRGMTPPTDMHVMRTCREARCVEPTHLELRADSDTWSHRDPASSGRTKLTAGDVRRIRRARWGEVAATAKGLDVSLSYVYSLRTPSRKRQVKAWRGVR